MVKFYPANNVTKNSIKLKKFNMINIFFNLIKKI